LVVCGLLVAGVLGPQSADACRIPVFRYALERWDPSPYDVIVLTRGPLDAALQERVK
jgi:hypothetical protein